MQRLFIFIFLLMFSSFAEAQVNRRPNNANSSYPLQGRDTGKSVTDFREKLVQLAMQNPEFEIADRRVSIADYELKKTKTKFLGHASAMVNYNEFSIKKQTDNIPNYYPKYNIGVNIPFDILISRSRDISIARENLSIAEATKNQQFREIKALVLASYEDYLMHKQKLDFQNQITQDVNVVYLTAEKDFTEGVITQTEYNTAYKAWSDEQSRKVEMQRNLNVAKIQLEQFIGMTLEEAVRK